MPKRKAGWTRREFTGTGVIAAGALSLARHCHGQSISKETVRFGIIGVGGRGTALLNILLQRPDTQVAAICDTDQAHLDRAIGIVQQAKGNTPARYSKDEFDYRNMLQRDDFDVVLIATSIKWHGVMSVDAMNAGKHVGSEVPACEDLSECAAMVAAKERNGVRYMLLENYLYLRDNLAVLEMTRRGLLGEPYFAECGYVHEYKTGQYEADGSLNWRGELMQYTHGNHYPTHSGGPVFKWLGINEGDRLQRLTCYATEPNRSARRYYTQRFGEEKASKLPFKLADMTTCLIRTERGKVIKMDLDIQSNRPHSFYYLLQGTKGIVDSRFGVSLVDEKAPLEQHPGFEWKRLEPFVNAYEHPLWKRLGGAASAAGHGGSDYFVVQDLADMVRYDREPWIDVYDAAAWSAVYECSRRSLDENNGTIAIPDYTRGRWKSTDWRAGRLPA